MDGPITQKQVSGCNFDNPLEILKKPRSKREKTDVNTLKQSTHQS